MDRKQAEKIIGEALELIRLTCEEFYPEYEHCSMYITPYSKAAYIIKDGDQDDGEYVLNYYKMEDENDESMAG